MGWGSVYAAAVRAAGALCVADLLESSALQAGPGFQTGTNPKILTTEDTGDHRVKQISHEQKSGPIAGATFQEVRFGGLSGKAMEVTVSPGEVALRELVMGNESEGHFFGFAAS
jgi:hypothetical protein